MFTRTGVATARAMVHRLRLVTRAVLFDMDGVLVSSEEIWFRSVEAAGVRFRGKAITRAEFTPTFGQGTAADIGCFGLECTPQELDRFYAEAFAQHLDELWVNPDAATVLGTLVSSHISRALVTNTVGPLATEILEYAQLRRYLPVLATADRVKQAKPAPDLLLLACEELGVKPAECVMVGDSRFDRAAAAAANVFFIGLGIDGDARIDRLAEVLDHVRP